MLFHFYNIDDRLRKYIQDDPVRPEIAIEDRMAGNNRFIAGFGSPEDPGAIVCYCLVDFVPKYESELFYEDNAIHDVACLYTIWSYKKGAGRQLIEAMVPFLKVEYSIKRIVTLSPTTEMARKFHLNNGAWMYRDNSDEGTVNYEYSV